METNQYQNWIHEFEANKGGIYTPDRRWITPSRCLPCWHGDVWCDPKEEIENPAYEETMARFMESIVAAGYCGFPGSARFNFVHSHVTDRAKGDLFDWNRIFIDRETLPRLPKDETTVCDAFGIAPRRCMNRLKESVHIKRTTTLRGPSLQRMCWLSLARSVFLARIGYHEYCGRCIF